MGNNQSNDSMQPGGSDRNNSGAFPNGPKRPGEMDKNASSNARPNPGQKGAPQRGSPDDFPKDPPQANDYGRTGGRDDTPQ
jgi:hypothetical protein